MSADARIAVLVPCFDDGEFVEETVDSIDEQEPIELVVIDDCSTDAGTHAALERLAGRGVRVLRHERNRGVGAARTTGLRATSAPLVFPLDSDDVAVAGAIGRMADLLEARPDAVACYGDYHEFGDHELLRSVPPTLDPYRVTFRNEYPPSALFRRTLLEAVGGWDEFRYRDTHYEDWDLWMTIAERGEPTVYAGAGFVTYRQRVHGPRLLEAAKRNHVRLYARLRERHPRLLAAVRNHRRRSDLPPLKKALYPVVFGRRPRYDFEPRVKELLERARPRRARG